MRIYSNDTETGREVLVGTLPEHHRLELSGFTRDSGEFVVIPDDASTWNTDAPRVQLRGTPAEVLAVARSMIRRMAKARFDAAGKEVAHLRGTVGEEAWVASQASEIASEIAAQFNEAEAEALLYHHPKKPKG